MEKNPCELGEIGHKEHNCSGRRLVLSNNKEYKE